MQKTNWSPHCISWWKPHKHLIKSWCISQAISVTSDWQATVRKPCPSHQDHLSASDFASTPLEMGQTAVKPTTSRWKQQTEPSSLFITASCVSLILPKIPGLNHECRSIFFPADCLALTLDILDEASDPEAWMTLGGPDRWQGHEVRAQFGNGYNFFFNVPTGFGGGVATTTELTMAGSFVYVWGWKGQDRELHTENGLAGGCLTTY